MAWGKNIQIFHLSLIANSNKNIEYLAFLTSGSTQNLSLINSQIAKFDIIFMRNVQNHILIMLEYGKASTSVSFPG